MAQEKINRLSEPTSAINLSKGERRLSAALGALLTAVGLIRRGKFGYGLSLVGSNLLYRSARGRSWLYHLSGKNRALVSPSAAVSVPHEQGIRVEEQIRIQKPPAEVYRFWRDLTHLPLFMSNVKDVTVMDDIHSHWVVSGPAGLSLEWDAEIINDVPASLIAWRSLDAQVDNAGTVQFKPALGGRGTDVQITLEYAPLGGAVGDKIAKLFGKEPQKQIASDLQKLKEVLEVSAISAVKTTPEPDSSDETPKTEDGSTDVVEIASDDSFPASDPPGY